ncbi:MAG: hypothetical protein EOO43_00885 [Flavobacterium sp.]|nr:MAG: hypothetical protein EOO43_00885 [Flavobacterium sp.]
MEAYLIENPSVLSMQTDGFNDVEILKCEVTLLDGRIDRCTDGRIDILAKYGQEYLAVVELKLGELTELHLIQLESYLKERMQILQKYQDIWDTNVGNQPKWIGIMIGATINPDLMLKIRRGYYFNNDIPIAALTINRFKGKDGNVYVITDTYFTDSVKNKDYTKYLFKGQKFGKNRLVLEVIKDFVERNPTITYSQLQAKFPNYLQGRETFTTEALAKLKNDRRNFIEPNELISLSDETIAVSTQWGIANIKPFIEHCKSMNIDINETHIK